MQPYICIAIDSNSSGGAERVMANLANVFVKDGVRVTFVNSDLNSDFYKLDERVKVVKLNLQDTVSNRYVRMICKFVKLVKLFSKEKPDCVLTFLPSMELPCIVASLVTGTKVFTSVRNSPRSYPVWVKVFRKILYRFVDGVVFQSRSVMGHDDFKMVKNKSVIVNPLAKKYINSTVVPMGDRKKWIINVGRLTKQKNQKLTIDAFDRVFAEHPDFELHIFGDGDLKEYLVNYSRTLNSSKKIIFEGVVDDAILKNKDVYAFVMSSDFEGFPNALAEAMAVGILCICTRFDSGVAEELIENGVNGFTVNVGDKNALSDCLNKIIDFTNDEYIAMSTKSRKSVEKLKSDNIAKTWLNFMLCEAK